MEVKLNANLGAVARSIARPIRTTPTGPAAADASFGSAEALDTQLRGTPDVRPEAVARAQQLIGNPKYPGDETIQRLANLLVSHLDSKP
jgi:hypothetical protein